MANFKKKNGHRKRHKLDFRNCKNNKAHSDSWRLNSLLRKFIKALKAIDEN